MSWRTSGEVFGDRDGCVTFGGDVECADRAERYGEESFFACVDGEPVRLADGVVTDVDGGGRCVDDLYGASTACGAVKHAVGCHEARCGRYGKRVCDKAREGEGGGIHGHVGGQLLLCFVSSFGGMVSPSVSGADTLRQREP